MMKSKSLLSKPSVLNNMTKITTKIALVSSALLLAFNVHSADKSYDSLHKQLDIMNNIMQSSAQSSQNSRKSLIRSIDSVYLQGQGAIFTVKSNHGSSSHHQFFQMVSPTAPVPPISGSNHVFIDDGEFDIEFEESEDEFERVIEIVEQQREGARELRSDQREMAYELRDLARERKDIEYQLQRAEKSTKDELTTKLKKIEKERVALKKNKAKLDQKVIQQSKKLAEQKAAQKIARAKHFEALNITLIDALCLYGNGLKSVPSNEYVTLIIKDAGSKKDRGYKDQIKVFTKKDIKACANNKITSQKLQTKAESYQF